MKDKLIKLYNSKRDSLLTARANTHRGSVSCRLLHSEILGILTSGVYTGILTYEEYNNMLEECEYIAFNTFKS